MRGIGGTRQCKLCDETFCQDCRDMQFSSQLQGYVCADCVTAKRRRTEQRSSKSECLQGTQCQHLPLLDQKQSQLHEYLGSFCLNNKMNDLTKTIMMEEDEAADTCVMSSNKTDGGTCWAVLPFYDVPMHMPLLGLAQQMQHPLPPIEVLGSIEPFSRENHDNEVPRENHDDGVSDEDLDLPDLV